MCTGKADQEIWNNGGSKSFGSEMEKCGMDCMGKSNCIATCMQKKERYTSGCTKGMGDLAGCSTANCMFQCMAGRSDSCVQCSETVCMPSFRTCSGLLN